MDYVKIVSWMLELEDDLFEEMKSMLLEKYISFSIVSNDRITKEMVCEKLCDYIEKTLIKTDKTFDSLINKYMDSFNDLVKDYLENLSEIDEAGKSNSIDSRATKFYKQAEKRRKDKECPLIGLEDYSRIMFCLYTEIIKNKRQPIQDFEYAFSCVKCQALVNSLESEEVEEKRIFNIKVADSTKRFNLKKKYNVDSFIMVMTIMMFYHLKSKEVRSEY